jgi:hypothetical protein
MSLSGNIRMIRIVPWPSYHDDVADWGPPRGRFRRRGKAIQDCCDERMIRTEILFSNGKGAAK